ncbi:WD40/YVTN/BNR-like repeat-containing protein [Sulfobacillus harzensis]|uniref:Photosynthesis system II assembly factor Ycf48/Hcf136-like domain-containing protein n=1 Tax=Sulfobacillus harzensis TaxID=2729629 RepID=A0A7Y0L7R2_9FIRM|nr:hypothetical protein [Sulfobacillus harzensis]NMP23469.1 hypothetical protein [Sulfobacillus harzensis]
MSKRRPRQSDPETVLRAYWQKQAAPLRLSSTSVSEALRRAERDGAIHLESRPRRAIKRALLNLSGLAVLAAVGIIVVPRLAKGLPHQGISSGTTQAAQAAAPQPRILAMTVSQNHLWLSEQQGTSLVLQSTTPRVEAAPLSRPSVRLPHTTAITARIIFSGRSGLWLLHTVSKGWVLKQTQNGGTTWQTVHLPQNVDTLSSVAAFLGGNHRLILLGTAEDGMDERDVQTRGGWVSGPATGLRGAIGTLWRQSGHLEASQQGQTYVSDNNGQSWRLSAVFGSAHSRSTGGVLQALKMSQPNLWAEGLASGTAFQRGLTRWVAVSGGIWRQSRLGEPWTKLSPLPFSGAAVSVGFVSDQTGYVLSARGALWETVDGGHKWARAR